MSIVLTEATRAQRAQRDTNVKLMREKKRIKHADKELKGITVQCHEMKKSVENLPKELKHVKAKIETEMEALMEDKAIGMLEKAGKRRVNDVVRDYAISVFEQAGGGKNKLALIDYLKSDPKEFIRYFKDVMIPLMKQDGDKPGGGTPMVQVNIYDGPDGGLNIVPSKVIDVKPVGEAHE